MLVSHKQDKLNEANQILEGLNDMTDMSFMQKLFHYHNELAEDQGEQGRRLKDEYNDVIRDTDRIVAKMEMKNQIKATKNLNRRHKFIKI